MDLKKSTCWDSIQERVRQRILTIDSDSLSSDDEESITLYQRPAGLSLTVPEDSDFFSVGDAKIELLETEETLDDDDEILKGTPVTQIHTEPFYTNVEAATCERADLERDGGNQDTGKENSYNKTYEGFPVLSFEKLDQWNLDHVLQELQEGQLSLPKQPMKTHDAGDCRVRSEKNIMERLVDLFQSQSSQSASESPNPTRQTDTQNTSSELSKQERPTIYTDLLCPDPVTQLSLTPPNLSSEFTTKHYIQQEISNADHLRVLTGSQVENREVTGKSMLLQKIRENKSKGNNPQDENSDPLLLVQRSEAELTEKHHAESTCSNESHHPKEEEQPLPAQFGLITTKIRSQETSHQSKIKEPKQQNNQQKQQIGRALQQKQCKKILEKLGKHCPTQSVHDWQPAEERTNILYHSEASYLQSLSTLPVDMGSEGRMVLRVNLSSPGVVYDGAYQYSAAARSHIYNTLVAWFLSLVGPNSRHDEDKGVAKVPFWVAGLQQLWTKDGLALHVLVVARHCYTPTIKQKDIHTLFYNHVCRFLSASRLPFIASWLPQLQSLLGQQSYNSTVSLPMIGLNSFIFATSQKKFIDQTFGVNPGFYWQTVESQESVCERRDTNQELRTEVSVSVSGEAFFLNPLTTHYTLQCVLDSGLDVCGLRLLYAPHSFLSDSTGVEAEIQTTDETCIPVLALAVRGPHAHSVIKGITTSLQSLLPREAEFITVNQRGIQDPQAHRELCLWFSGRLIPHPDRIIPAQNRHKSSVISSYRSPSSLCATTKADVLLIVSPIMPQCCYAQILAVCERRGFCLLGLQRLEVKGHGASLLGFTNKQMPVFCSTQTVDLEQEKQKLPRFCLVLMLRKENATHHSVRLPAALMRELEAQKLLGCIHARLNGAHTVEADLCFHAVPYSSDLFHIFVRCMWAVPDPSRVILSKWSSTPDREQVVILALVGKDLSQGLSFLHRVLTGRSKGDVFQLLGLKFLPALTLPQARELTPYEVGEQLRNDSVNNLMSSQVLVCALSRVEAVASLRKLLPHDYPANILVSATPEVAFRQASVFFFEHEMIPAPQIQLTVCLFKHRIWHKALSKTVHKLHLRGLLLVGLRVFTLDTRAAGFIQPSGNEPADLECLCSGSSLALCLEGEDAVRQLLGVLREEDMAPLRDGIYASGSYQTAIQDVKKIFPDGLCCSENITMRQEQPTGRQPVY
ncbi:dynein axonemal assembly factor 8 isoform X2 [Halichoeres trimaculatus]|uniref:dynein axonemal assembly factor 8 isoform X2 n=1 Tax=Halichoeres trimaculatus TaxID=147232 RepID=UPI003D9EF859